MESNINTTVAEYATCLENERRILLHAICTLADKALLSDDFSILELRDLLADTPLQICVWCLRKHINPSDFIKVEGEFKQHGYDNEIGGDVCDLCLLEMSESETRTVNKVD